MKQSDFDGFRKLLNACLSMWGDAPSAEVSAMWFRCLAEYDMPIVSAAFNAHMRDPSNGKFAPKPAHIIEQIRASVANDGRLGPEEAWALALKARDEAETVVWTSECMQAWFAAKPVMDFGDEVGARMAFREVYTRLVNEARDRSEEVTWEISEGFDQDRRRLAVAEAVEAGRICGGNYLALPNDAGALMLEYDKPESSGIPPEVRERLKQLREMLTRPYDGPSEADIERERTAALKRELQARVAQYVAA